MWVWLVRKLNWNQRGVMMMAGNAQLGIARLAFHSAFLVLVRFNGCENQPDFVP